MLASCPVHLRNLHPNVSWRAATSMTVVFFGFLFWALSQGTCLLDLVCNLVSFFLNAAFVFLWSYLEVS